MPCHTDVSLLLHLARDEKRPLALAFPDDAPTDSAPAVIAAEVLDNAARGHVATRSALAAAAQHITERPAALRLLAHVLAPPMRGR
ncbi:hypothetical protein [Streptacidiphilus anmyonensis]|uniref:hypothetical protein n=1 Tax=Streptacidiphilus anmyonensis TaxID=405782 RepID=UPI0005A6E98E|nr:hypothetical protein [Streptacidiphilus anmyonensis]